MNIEPASRKGPRIPGGEICRKALHMSPGLFPFILVMIPHPDPLTWNEIGFVIQLCVVFTLGFLALTRVVKRPGERDLLVTVLSYPLIIVVMLALFPGHAEFTGVVVSVLAFGDGAAYFGGTLFGRRKLPWNPKKSWAGTIAFVCLSAPIGAFAYWLEARNPQAPFLMAACCALVASVAGTIAESLPTRLSDNLRVGVAASLGVVAAHYALAPLLLK